MQSIKYASVWLGCLMLTGGIVSPSLAATPRAAKSPQTRLIPAVAPATVAPAAAPVELAQRSNPNEDRLPQQLPDPEDALPPEDPAEVTPPAEVEPPPPLPGADTLVTVNQLEVVGSTIFSAEDFAPLVEPVEGREATIGELQTVASQITQLYIDAGYITSQAILPEQEITDGVIELQVIEGRISEIQVEGNQQTRTPYIQRRVALGSGTPVRLSQVEDQLRLLQLNPLFEAVSGTLSPGENLGESILTVTVEEDKPFSAELGVDNYSPPSVGSVRLGGELSYRNLTGWGDEINAAYRRTTTGGANTYDLGYKIPLNAMDGTLQLRSILGDNNLEGDFDISGNSEFYEVAFRQPLVRSPRQELALSLGFAYREGQTFLFNSPFPFGVGPDDDGFSRTSVFKFGQDYVRRDVKGAWALLSQFSLGTGLFEATNNSGDTPDGQFFSWLGQVQRVQRLNSDHLLIVQLSGQLTPNSLLASEQFVIGGGRLVRGYRQNARSGDNGFRFSIEDRMTVLRDDTSDRSILQVMPFVDMGYVWNHPNNPNSQFSERFLIGTGAGLLFEPEPNLQLRFDYGLPLVDLDDRGTNIQDDGFYFSVNYTY
ncbi:MAG: ShlB/FhaC/HecB family hemolysin secretion/activation protein [Cyanobacteria bacterium J06627_15]